MQTYFFHLRNGKDLLLDDEGRDLEFGEVAAAAMREARAMIAADIPAGAINLDQGIEVEDDAGSVVHRTAFTDAISITLNGRLLY